MDELTDMDLRWARWRNRRTYVHLRVQATLGCRAQFGAWLGSAYLRATPRFWVPSDEVCPTECVVEDKIGNRVRVPRVLLDEIFRLREVARRYFSREAGRGQICP